MSPHDFIVFLMLLASVFGHKSKPAQPAPAIPAHAVYVPGPQNKYAPKPSCATMVDLKTKRGYLAVCTTTHGLVVKGPYSTEREATRVADAIYDAEFAAQGGVLLQ